MVAAATLAAWYAFWFVLRHDASAAHRGYLVVAAALWAGMAALDPALLWVGTVALVPHFLWHARWAAGGIVACGGGWLCQRYLTGGGLDRATVGGSALAVLAAVAVVAYIATLDREGRKRQRLLDDVAATHSELTFAERRSGILAERERLARDIHDTLTQGFVSIAMLLDAALADLPPDTPASRQVSQALRAARENLAESRRVIEAMRPVPLDGARLPEAIRQLVSRLREETGVAADTVVSGEPLPLDPTTEAELLRVVAEALTNVRRHAAARELTVTVSYLDDVVAIDVADDGLGFNEQAAPVGVGLAAMRERVGGLGGTLVIESTPGEGHHRRGPRYHDHPTACRHTC